MTTADVVRLLLGSAVLNAIVSAVITGWFNRNITHQELTAEAEWRDRQRREDRLKIAAELVRLKQESVIEGGRQSGAEVTIFDPAVALADYLKALDEITSTGVWAFGEQHAAPHRRR